jgi:hypothetical protein
MARLRMEQRLKIHLVLSHRLMGIILEEAIFELEALHVEVGGGLRLRLRLVAQLEPEWGMVEAAAPGLFVL